MKVYKFEIWRGDAFVDFIQVAAKDRDHAESILLRNGFWMEDETLKLVK